jgi:glycosyltransferase involved in cell wall biosynthesis
MHCLWLTLADPEPATNGQLIYSRGLIEATRKAGAELCVVGLARPEKSTIPPDEHGLAWRLAGERRRSRRQRLLQALPDVASRGRSPEMDRLLARTLGERDWDVVVFDSICSGWGLDTVLRHRARARRRPKLVYLAHNHEITVARRIAEASHGPRRLLKEIDALKVVRLERRLVAEADLVTSNTPEDRRTFVRDAGRTPVALLPPGYDGPRVLSRTIDAGLPRRAVVVGSFDWSPKRISLERFLAVAAPVLQRAGIELQIVGAVESAYLGSLRERHPSVTFAGPVDDVRPYMAAARIALVPDLLGGFKLKGLDYVFNRMPILSMRIALPGMPLRDGHSIGLFDSHEALARGVIALIDDCGELNRRQGLAFEACAARFDWPPIGRHLLRAIGRLDPSAAAARGRAAAPSSATGSALAPAAAGR